MIIKEFDQELYLEYDKRAKDAFMSFLRAGGLDPKIPENPYDIDIEVMMPDGRMIYFDVEVRPMWTRGCFPFSSVHLPLRKEKYISDKTWFVSFRKDLRACLIFQIKDKSSQEEIPNKYVASGERFFDVPLVQTRFIDFDNL